MSPDERENKIENDKDTILSFEEAVARAEELRQQAREAAAASAMVSQETLKRVEKVSREAKGAC